MISAFYYLNADARPEWNTAVMFEQTGTSMLPTMCVIKLNKDTIKHPNSGKAKHYRIPNLK